jgi:serine/threonine-protein kinase
MADRRTPEPTAQSSVTPVERASSSALLEGTPTVASPPPASAAHRFRILRLHAEGGLGEVFVAQDLELNREVALKQIKEQCADDPSSRERFLFEAEVTGGLEHPGIVPVYGLGRDATGRPYYAMRFIRGESLKDAIADCHARRSEHGGANGSAAPDVRKLVDRLRSVCDAIGYAHSRGVVHRDIKPANIMLGKYGETLVVDWGLARSVSRPVPPDVDECSLRPSSGQGDRTIPGTAVGTPQYMSPEQAEGRLDRIGPASDVYSLGATLYCILTGRPPVEGQNLGDIYKAVRRGDYPRPRALRPEIPRPLEAICLKAMALAPEGRYAAAQALGDDLERWLADRPVAAWPEPWEVRARRWVNCHRTGMATAAGCLVFALVGLAGVAYVESRAAERLGLAYKRELRVNADLRAAIAREARANDRSRARFALATDAIKGYATLASDDPRLRELKMGPIRRDLLTSSQGYYRKLQELLEADRDPGERAELAEAWFQLAEVSYEIDSTAEALRAYQEALAIRRKLIGADRSVASRHSLARALYNVAFLNWELNRPADALAACDESIEVFEQLDATNDLTVSQWRGRSYSLRASLLWDVHSVDEAARAFRAALDYRQRLSQRRPDDSALQGELAETYLDLAAFQYENETAESATASFQAGQAALSRATRDHVAWTTVRRAEAVAWAKLGGIEGRRGRFQVGLDAYNTALRIQRELVAERPAVVRNRIDLALTLSDIGGMHALAGATGPAVEATRSALEVIEPVMAANPGSGRPRLIAATCYDRLGIAALQEQPARPDDALQSFRQAEAIARSLVRANPRNRVDQMLLGEVLLNLGKVAELHGRYDEALARAREAGSIFHSLELPREGWLDVRWRTARSDFNEGVFLLQLGRFREAVEPLDRAITSLAELVRANPSVDPLRVDLASAHLARGGAYRGMGQIAEARASYRRGLAIEDELMRRSAPQHQAQVVRIIGSLALADPSDLSTDFWSDLDRIDSELTGAPSVDPDALLNLACIQCWARARPRPPGAPAADADPRRRCDARAIAAIRRAVAAGISDPARLVGEPDFAPLWDLAEFRQLLGDWIVATSPFARVK